MMENPFKPAGWGEEYYLAGFLWKPEPFQSHGSIVYWKSTQGIDVVKGVSGQGYINGVNIDDALPLLPSPGKLTREQAIAALQRAGFERFDCDVMEIYWGTNHKNGFLAIDDGEVLFKISSYDPDLTQYAVDCFKVLKAWADAVEWEK